MRTCLFCGAILQGNDKREGRNRAKEHVLRNSWLEKLGHSKTPLFLGRHDQTGFIKEDCLVADQLQTGEICGKCNGGWMDQVDHRVESFVLKMASGEDVLLAANDSLALSRWVLKVACCAIYTDRSNRRFISEDLRRNMPKSDYLPSGFLAFCTRFNGLRGLGYASLDAWYEQSQDVMLKVQPTSRLKFAVQYDNVIFGCAYLRSPFPEFTGIEGFHHPLVLKQAHWKFRKNPYPTLEALIDSHILPDEVHSTPVNMALLTIDGGFTLVEPPQLQVRSGKWESD